MGHRLKVLTCWATLWQFEAEVRYVQLRSLFVEEYGQDIAEYAVMVAVILLIVIGTVPLIGSNSNTVFSNVASAIQ